MLALLALCAIATCPTAKRSCNARNEAREADDLLEVIADRVAERVALTGKVPPLAAGPTPLPSCCDQGGTCSNEASTWAGSGWRDLQFSVDGTYRYTYEYVPDPSGASALVRAIGDLDCNHTASTYELKLTVKGTEVERVWSRSNPFE
jgi:hypothetical protein